MSKKEILIAAEKAWLKWHEDLALDADDDDGYIPEMSPLWLIAFEVGVEWEAKGEK